MNRRRLIFSGIFLLLAAVVIGDMRDNLQLQMRVYRYRPDLFADQPYGSLFSSKNIPIPGLWYVKLAASTAHLYGIEQLRQLVDDRGIPGLDFSGEKDITDADFDPFVFPALTRPDARMPADPSRRFKLLRLAGTSITDKALMSIGRLTDLEVLTLNNRITDQGLPFLRQLFQLRDLDLSNSRVTSRSLAQVFQFNRLERLNLSGTAVSNDGMNQLRALPLVELTLGPRISDAGLLAALSPAMAQLDLSQTRVSDDGLIILSKLPRLHTLFLGPQTSDSGLRYVAAAHTIQRLDLTGTRITDAGVHLLSPLVNLEELALSQTEVHDTAIEALRPLKKLRFLEISNTRITEAGLQRLAGIPSLQVISFTAARLPAPERFAAWRKLPNLHTVIVNGRPMTADWMATMKGTQAGTLPWIATAYADDTPVEIAQLQENPHKGVTGLHLIHQVESDLDNIIPAPTMINIDNQQDTEKNFMGEFTVEAGRVKKKSAPARPQ
jgi:hypothetical protein